MCVVSAVGDYGREKWPLQPPKTWPYGEPWNPPIPNLDDWEKFKEAIEKAREIDDLTGQPDCEDPEKTDWMKEMEERVNALEGKKEEPFFDFGLHLETIRDIAKELDYLHRVVGGGTLETYAKQLLFIASLMEKQIEA